MSWNVLAKHPSLGTNGLSGRHPRVASAGKFGLAFGAEGATRRGEKPGRALHSVPACLCTPK